MAIGRVLALECLPDASHIDGTSHVRAGAGHISPGVGSGRVDSLQDGAAQRSAPMPDQIGGARAMKEVWRYGYAALAAFAVKG